MANYSKFLAILSGVQKQVDLSTNTLVVNTVTVGGGAGTDLTKTILDNLVNLQNGTDFSNGTNSHTHDGRYYTQSQLNSGTASSGSDLIGDDNTYSFFTPAAATVKGALSGIDSALGSMSASSALDGTFRIKNSVDQTKQLAFSVSGLTTGTTRTITMPDANVDLGNLTNSNISASAAIAYSKLNLSSSIVNADISGSAAIAYSKLNLATSIVNGDISASAAIAYSKLNLALSIVNGDISATAAIAYSKLNLASSIVNADVSATAAIAYSKLSLTSSIVNSDVSASAAIDYSKLAALTASKALVSDVSGVITTSATTSTEIGYVSGVTSSIQTQINSKAADNIVIKKDGSVTYTASQPMGGFKLTGLAAGSTAGDSVRYEQAVLVSGANAFTADQSMGGFKLTNVANGTSANDAVNFSQLQAVSNGNIWLEPVQDPDLVDDSLSTPPGSPIDNTTYLIGPTPTGAWSSIGAGHLVYYSGGTWHDVLGRAVQVGDRFGVTLEHGSGSEGGNMVGNHNKIFQVTNATPGSYAYSIHSPVLYDTVLVNQPNSQHFSHSYNYNGTSWVEIAGPGVITAGSALAFTGNTLNVLYDNATIDVNISNQLEVKAGSITNTQIATSAAIAYSKLSLTSSIVNADVSSSAAIAYAKLNLAGSIVNSDIATGAAISYSKLSLTGSIVNADISATAAIVYSKLSLANSIVNADIATAAAIAYSKLSLTSSIVNADISATAAIAYSKLNLSASIVNADIATGAAIAYSKLNLTGSVALADLAANSVDENKIVSTSFSATGAITGGSASKIAVQVDSSTIEINTNALRIKDAGVSLAKLASNSVDENKIVSTTYSATGAIAGGSGSKVAVQVDNSTIAISANALQVKNSGVSATQLATGAADQITITGGAGTALAVQQAPLLKRTLVAGESFAANTSFAVRWALNGQTAGRVYKADKDATSSNNYMVIGIALTTAGVTAGQNIDVVLHGEYTLGSSDTAFNSTDVGKELFLGSSGAIILGSALANTANEAQFCLGVIQATNKIWVDFKQLRGIY